MKEKVLVTGANSMLGTHIIHELLAEGYAVRGLLRRIDSYVGDENPSLELVEGDFTDGPTLRHAMSGCTGMIHCAARTGQSGAYSSYVRVNVTAVVAMAEIAAGCGIRKIVNISSANVFAYGTKDAPGDETRPIEYPFTDSAYARSKFEALRQLERFRDRIDIVSVCPAFMIGAWDSRPSSGKIILLGYGRRIMFCPPGGKNFVAAGDVARGAVAALERGRNGEQYLLSGENLTYKEFYRLLSGRTGHKQFLVRVPGWLLRVAGCFGDMLAWLGIQSEVSLANMRILCVGNYYSNAKAVRELGFHCRPLADAIDEAVLWFRNKNMLPGEF